MKQDEGGGSIWMISVIGILTAATLVVCLLAQVFHLREQAASAADAAAIAGADHLLDGPGAACVEARRFAASNGAQLLSCVAQDSDVQVTVGMRMAGPFARLGQVQVDARARLESGIGHRI